MKIKVTSVYVDDQDKALRFYTEVLGFALFVQTPSAHLRSMSIMNFAVLSSGVAQWLCCAQAAVIRTMTHITTHRCRIR